jgi:hypothetical protein
VSEIKFRRDKAEEAVRWVHSLKERQEEVAELLDAEGFGSNRCFSNARSRRIFISYVRANSLEQAYEAFMKSQISISEETRNFIDEMWRMVKALN